jgi:hypothetical protein
MAEVSPPPEEETKDAAGLAGDLADRDPAVGLHAVWALRTLLERVERLQVDNARSAGWSWADIARVLRVSKQSVHEKHAARRKALGMEA